MGNLPFTVYFDFETTTRDSAINNKKCFLLAIVKYLFLTVAKSSKNCDLQELSTKF